MKSKLFLHVILGILSQQNFCSSFSPWLRASYYNRKNIIRYKRSKLEENSHIIINHEKFTRCFASTEDDISRSDATYNGPILEDFESIISGISLPEVGIDLAIAPSTVVPGQLGLFLALSSEIDSVTLPALTLLCGYSRNGRFEQKDEGDRTVGFAFSGANVIDNTAVFYERQLMSIQDALTVSAESIGKKFGDVELAGHILVEEDDDKVGLYPCDYEEDDESFARFFLPDLLNGGMVQDSEEENDEDETSWTNDLTVQNFGQFCNDLSWSYTNPPESQEDYDMRSEKKNVVQLIWRLEFDSDENKLKPSWPVSVLSRDWTFTNKGQFMEIGTKYGWNYWQATVDVDNIK